MDELEGLKGQWHLPGSHRNVVGTLRQESGRGIWLDLDGTPVPHSPSNAGFRVPIILGRVNGGQPVTLLNCQGYWAGDDDFGRRSRSRIVCTAETAIIGSHIHTLERVRFDRLAVRFEHLDEWANASGFKVRANPLKDPVLIEHSRPKEIIAKVAGHRVTVGFTSVVKQQRLLSATVEQRAYVQLEWDEPQALDKLYDEIRLFQQFLSFAMNYPTFPSRVYAVSVNKAGLGRQGDWNEIRHSWTDGSETAAAHYRWQMLFRLSDVVARFPDFVAAWFTQAPRLGVVYDMYISCLKDDDANLEGRFLRLTQALETLHRRLFDGKYMGDDVFRTTVLSPLYGAIPAGIDSGFRDRLQGYLKYGNEFSLRKRLCDLVDGASPQLERSSCLPWSNAFEFVNRVCDVRNYFTHYDAASEGSTVTEPELQELVRGVFWLLQTQLMLTVGFTHGEIAAVRG